MYDVDAFCELRASNLRARLPLEDVLGLAGLVEQIVDIDATEQGGFIFTCRHLTRRLVPNSIDDYQQRIEVRESQLAVRLNALAAHGILRAIEGPGGKVRDGCDWLPAYELADVRLG